MGQEASSPVDPSVAPETLERRDLAAVAKLIKDKQARRIVVLAGAGLSTAAGIPDFRSPGTGLYANLERLRLPVPEAVFDIRFFRRDPVPFYTLAGELFPGKYRPTISHAFVRLLADKGLLLMMFTQNIDCLERQVGVPVDKIVEAHGSFATSACIDCKAAYPDGLMKQAVEAREAPRCLDAGCGGLVKPEIVFFGEALPRRFEDLRHLPAEADLCLVMGTSLSVQPFAGLPADCARGVPRVLINREPVGRLGSRADDVLILSDCDAGVRSLAAELGWLEELEALWDTTRPAGQEARATADETPKTADEKMEAAIDRLTGELDRDLKVSRDHEQRVRDLVGTPTAGEVAKGQVTVPDESSIQEQIPRGGDQVDDDRATATDDAATTRTSTRDDKVTDSKETTALEQGKGGEDETVVVEDSVTEKTAAPEHMEGGGATNEAAARGRSQGKEEDAAAASRQSR
ncbi:MAG: Sir2 histone deacetylase Hst2 [Thelocarpon impressellum]|nr:MAG: Sir2 histone deacetylase Hst2 [Thelocarpon impressellum]